MTDEDGRGDAPFDAVDRGSFLSGSQFEMPVDPHCGGGCGVRWVPVRTEVDALLNLHSSVSFEVDSGVSFRHVRYWKFRLDSLGGLEAE